MERKRGIVVTGGRAPEGPIAIQDREEILVVAADSGVETAERLGIAPDVIVGDMDSIEDLSLLERYENVDIERYDRAKDWTDTEIGVQYLWKRKITDITILGGGGGRLDHLLGIVALFHRDPYPRRWITNREEVVVVDREIEFESPPDRRVSFFPVGEETCTMESRGLRWELTGLTWKWGDVGISNECLEKTCRVTIHTGRLVKVQSLPTRLVL